jgi:outer membrane receptor protein involved in Fe transport
MLLPLIPRIKTPEMLSIIPNVEYISARYASGHMVSINTANINDRYFLAGLKISADLTKNITLSAGVENIFDENYVLDDGTLPLPGRTYNLTLSAKY